MPLEPGVAEAGRVRHPAAHQVRTRADHPDDEATTPVVTDQIDLARERLELGDEPGDVLLLGRTEARWTFAAEARQLQSDDVVATEMRAQRVPQGGRLRYTVDQNSGHGRQLLARAERPG